MSPAPMGVTISYGPLFEKDEHPYAWSRRATVARWSLWVFAQAPVWSATPTSDRQQVLVRGGSLFAAVWPPSTAAVSSRTDGLA